MICFFHIVGYEYRCPILGAFRDNFSGCACSGNSILRNKSKQFCVCLEQPGRKCESVFLFNTKMPADLRVGHFMLVRGTDTMF